MSDRAARQPSTRRIAAPSEPPAPGQAAAPRLYAVLETSFVVVLVGVCAGLGWFALSVVYRLFRAQR